MLPGPGQILTCPHCGAHKEVLSLLSGNTFGQEVWSDNKTIAPMLPRVSFVQKCPSCGGYFLMSRQYPKNGNDSSFDTGDLSYLELKEAWHSLNDASCHPELYGWSKIKKACGLSSSKNTHPLTNDEKLSVLIMLVWAFNDEYTRTEVKPAPFEEQEYICSIIDQLLELDQVDDLLKAEFLRESGRFQESMSLLNKYSTEDQFLQKLIKRLKEENLASNTRPFLISGSMAYSEIV